MLSPEQAAVRASRVGASEVSGLLNEHRYATPYNIYERIVDGIGWEPEPGSPAWVGQQLEPTIMRMARTAFGFTTARLTSKAAKHDTLPLSASADGYARDYLVEIKVTSAWGFRAGECPSYIKDQCIVQAALYGKPVVHLVVLNGSRFWTEPIYADPDRYLELEAAVADFEVTHLQPRLRPAKPVFTTTTR